MDETDRAQTLTALLPRLRRRARRYAATADAAEDLLQEALLRVWRRLAEEPPIDDLDRYVFVTLRNLARRSVPLAEELTDANMPRVEPMASLRIAQAEVLVAMSHLPPAQATLLLDHAIDGESYAELARRHGLPIGTVMSRVARGRARLRARLDLSRNRPVADMLNQRG
ncbi:MAG: RNA polymerase sigma factor [Rhodobacteraceae bacterium]|nr:RNA polymerase sigma factor [Alphaproteobacteria bacterium]MBT8476111.1 RNA polymerase sigma factor [Alphaproteobacteria bacterium]NNF73113.1 RNA polymerase sigma factor [Paracoccaceae bacterium]NNK68246.1 RNA polymerase sigma factor [Paracoccaceae bacterium]